MFPTFAIYICIHQVLSEETAAAGGTPCCRREDFKPGGHGGLTKHRFLDQHQRLKVPKGMMAMGVRSKDRGQTSGGASRATSTTSTANNNNGTHQQDTAPKRSTTTEFIGVIRALLWLSPSPHHAAPAPAAAAAPVAAMAAPMAAAAAPRAAATTAGMAAIAQANEVKMAEIDADEPRKRQQWRPRTALDVSGHSFAKPVQVKLLMLVYVRRRAERSSAVDVLLGDVLVRSRNVFGMVGRCGRVHGCLLWSGICPRGTDQRERDNS